MTPANLRAMKRLVLALGALLLAAGCDRRPMEVSACAARHGLYRGHYQELAGTCGPVADIVSDADAAYTAECDGRTLPPDACGGLIDMTCPIPGPDGLRLVSRWHLEWAPAADSGSAILEVERRGPEGGLVCSSTYLVDFWRVSP